MASALQISLTALGAFQKGMQTISHNVTNAQTDGYSRQTLSFHSMGDKGLQDSGGVYAGDPIRNYNDFLRNQINTAEARTEYSDKYLELANRLTGLFGGVDSGVSQSIDDFYLSANDLRNNPTSSSSQGQFYTNASYMVSSVRNLATSLNEIRYQVNTEVEGGVDELNNVLSRLAVVNANIAKVGAQAGNSVNDLYDSRDRLINEVNTFLDADASIMEDGRVELYTQGGISLVSGNYSATIKSELKSTDVGMTLENSDYIPSYGVWVTTPHGDIDVSDKISEGKLGAVMTFREEALEPAERNLGHAIMAMTQMINAQQKAGYTYEEFGTTGERSVGQNMFDPLNVTMVQGADATVAPALNVSFEYWSSDNYAASLNQVATQDQVDDQQALLTNTNAAKYSVVYDSVADEMTVQNISDTNVAATTFSGTYAVYEGLAFDLSNATGDLEFEIDPFSVAIREFALVSDFTADKIAVSNQPDIGDTANSGNIELIEDLKDLEFLNGGNSTPQDLILDNASQVGSQYNSAELNSEAFLLQLRQLEETAAESQGVNIDTELSTLLQYQQAYQAAGKVIQTSNSVFDALLAAI